MDWSLSVGGKTEEGEGTEAVARKLGQVLAELGSGVKGASFSSGDYSGDPRLLAEQATAAEQ